MGVELINDKEPWGLRIRSNSLGDMRGKVFFSSPGSYGGRHHFPRRHVEVGDQTLRPMAEVCLRGALDEAWWPRQGGGGPLQRLYPRLLIGTDDMLPLLGDRWRVLVHRTYCRHLGGKRHGVIRLGVEPVVHSMGLSIDLIVKNARHCGC